MGLDCCGLVLFCGRGLRVLTLSDPGQLSARAALFPGELEHAFHPHFAVQRLVSGGVGPEYSLLPPYRENTLTTGTLSFGVSGVPHTGRTDSRCHLNQTAPNRIPHLACLSGLVQSSRLTPSTLEAVFWPAQSSRSLLARLLGNAHLKVSPPRKNATDFGAQGRRKLKPQVLLLLCFMPSRLGASSAVPEPSMLTPQVPFV